MGAKDWRDSPAAYVKECCLSSTPKIKPGYMKWSRRMNVSETWTVVLRRSHFGFAFYGVSSGVRF